MDITKKAFPDDFFNAVSCLNVLEHIEDDAAALAEIRRVLQPKGIAVITVPVGPSLYDFNDEVHFHLRRYRPADHQKEMPHRGLGDRRGQLFRGCGLSGVFISVRN